MQTTRTTFRVDAETLSLIDAYHNGLTRSDKIRNLLNRGHRFLMLDRANIDERRYLMRQDRSQQWEHILNVRIDKHIVDYCRFNGINITTLLKYASRGFSSNK